MRLHGRLIVHAVFNIQIFIISHRSKGEYDFLRLVLALYILELRYIIDVASMIPRTVWLRVHHYCPVLYSVIVLYGIVIVVETDKISFGLGECLAF